MRTGPTVGRPATGRPTFKRTPALPPSVCTLAFAWHCFDDAPLLVGANRDESLGRPSAPPAVREWERRVLAPKDREAGGTWMGVNDAGLFVGVTNRWGDVEGGGERSRGLLVRDALGAADARSARALVRDAVAEDRYNGFYLVLADVTGGDDADAFCCWWDGSLHETAFEPGVHVVANEGFDDGDAKARWARDALRGCETVAEWRERTRGVLRTHADEATDTPAVCVHGDGYGTRSSSLVTVDRSGATFEFADGPPCETAYERVAGEFP